MRTLPLVVLAGVALWTSCGAGGSAPVLTERVRMFDMPGRPEKEWGYDPREIRVPAGTTVTFTNSGAVFHTVTSDDPGRSFDFGADAADAQAGGAAGASFDIGVGAVPGGQLTVRFERPGRYAYHCGVHPDMKGVVHVCDGACK